MVRILLVLLAVSLVGLVQVPPLIRQQASGELLAVAVLLVLSLGMGLFIMVGSEGYTAAFVLTRLLEPIGSMLFGPR